MTDASVNNKRIAKNTLLLYVRMCFLMIISLYTSRVILDALGVEDYGIYEVVGGFVSMFALISGSLTNACTRFLNYEQGRNDVRRQNVIFSTLVTIQWSLAILVAILAEFIGIWYVNNVMVLPVERLTAANWCFQISLFNFCTNLIIVPYNASIIAHEKMKAFAYVGLYQGIAQLGVTFLIYLSPCDKLIFYALLLLLIQLSVRTMYHIYCRRYFMECTYRFVLDKPIMRHILSYSFWHLVGNGAEVLKSYGVNLVLNYFWGPVVNAARGISNHVNSAVGQFATNFMMAMNPQITKSYAKGDYEYMHFLVNKGSCFSFYLLLLLSLPIIVNADFILHLWLKNVPQYSVAFVQLSLVSRLIASISKPLITAQNATGNVRNYQLIIGGIDLLNLPLSFIVLYLGFSPTSVVLVSISVIILSSIIRIYILPLTLPSFNPKFYFQNVIFKCICVAIVASIIPVFLLIIFSDTFIHFVLNVCICLIVSVMSIYYIGCSDSEKLLIKGKIKEFMNKFISN